MLNYSFNFTAGLVVSQIKKEISVFKSDYLIQ